MAVLPFSEFLDLLEKKDLLDPGQLEELRSSSAARNKDTQGLGKFLFEKGWLTRFQITALANGRDIHLGPYRLLDRIGEGGMGQVYKAHHVKMDRVVALKVIRKERLANPDAVKRFQREIQMAAKLVHTNIVIAYDANQIGDVHYFVMEYIEGTDLSRLVKNSGPLPVAQACEFTRQAALGLAHAHEQGLVHRDIKPSNLLVSGRVVSGELSTVTPHHSPLTVKILDMGLARSQLGKDVDTSLTQEGAVVGTPDYLAPEQAVDSRNVDARCDVYSLGCTLYFLLAGEPPYKGKTMAELLLKHQLGESPPVESKRPDVPTEVAAVVRKAMAKKPADRYQSANEMALALAPFSEGAGSVPIAHPVPTSEKFASTLNVQPVKDTPSPWSPAGDRGKTGPASRSGSGSKTRPGNAVAAGASKKPWLVVGVLAGVLVASIVGVVLIALVNSPPRPTQPVADGGAGATSPGTDTGKSGETNPNAKDTRTVGKALTLAPLDAVTLKPGETRTLVVKIERQGFAGAVSVIIANLPPEVIAQPLTIEAGSSSGQLRLQALASASDVNRKLEVVASAGNVVARVETQLSVQTGGSTVVGPTGPLAAHEIRRYLGHTSAVDRVAVSPDGTRILSAGMDNTARLWDLETGQELNVLRGHTGPVRFARFAPDGKRCLTCSNDGTARLWDVATGKEGTVFRGHAGAVWQVAFTLDGQRIATCGDDRTARLWDAATGKEIRSYLGHQAMVHNVEVTLDGKHLLTGSTDRSVRLWELETGKEVRQFTGHTAPVCSLAVAGNGMALSGSHDQTARLWDISSGSAIQTLTGHTGNVWFLCFSPDGSRALSASSDGSIRLWDLKSARSLQILVGHQGGVTGVVFTPDGNRAVTSGQDNTVRLWDLTKMPTAAAVADKPMVVTAESRRLDIKQNILRAAFSPTSQRLLIQSGPNLSLWDLEKSQELRRLAALPGGGVSAIAITADGQLGITASADRMVRLWDLNTSQGVRQFQGMGSPAFAVAISADGRRIAAGGGMPFVKDGKPVMDNNRPVFTDCEVRVWDLQTAKLLATLTGNDAPIAQLALSADGKHLVSAARNGFLTQWDVDSGKQSSRINPPGGAGIHGVTLLGDGNPCLAAFGDRTLRLLDLQNRMELRRFDGQHLSPIHAIAVSPDGKQVLSCSGAMMPQAGPSDCVMRLWDAATGREIRRFEGHTHLVRGAAFSADGKQAISASADGTIRFWDLAAPGTPVVVKPADPMPPPTPAKSAVPDKDKQAEARKQIHELYKQDFARKLAAERLALAQKLITKGRDTKDDSLARFVVFREAMEVAAEVGDTATVLTAIDLLDQDYAVEVAELKVKALTAVGKQVSTPTPLRALAEAALFGMEDAYDADNFDAAAKLFALAESAVKKSSTPALTARLDARRKELPQFQKEFEAFKAGTAALQQSPSDPTAALAVGKYQCFRKNEWAKGLPLLAGGKDPSLQSLAKKDLAKPTAAAAQVEVADGWYDLGDADATGIKLNLLKRAAFWYQQAETGITAGLTRDRIEKRLKAVQDLTGASKPPDTAAGFRKLDGHKGKVAGVAFLPDNQRMLTAGEDNTIRMWDLKSGKETGQFATTGAPVGEMAMAPNGKRVMAISAGNIQIWEIEGKRPLNAVNAGSVPGISFAAADGGRIVYGNSTTGLVQVWTYEAGGGLVTLNPTKMLPTSVTGSADGRFAFVGAKDGLIHFFTIEPPKQISSMRGHTSDVIALAVSRDGRTVVSSGADKTVRVWDAATSSELRRLRGFTGTVTALALSPDGRRLLTGGDDKIVRVWDTRNGQELRRFTGHTDKVLCVAFSPDGNHAISGSADQSARVWVVVGTPK